MKTMDYITAAEQRLTQNIATALINGQIYTVYEMKLFVTSEKLLTSVHLICERIVSDHVSAPREDLIFEALTATGRRAIVTVLKTLK